MARKSVWATLIIAVLIASTAFFHAPSTASASPAHVALHQTAAHPNAPAIIAGCPSGQHLLIGLGVFSPSVFGNYNRNCITNAGTAGCSETGAPSFVCLYQNSNYNNNGTDGGQEIDFVGNGCANLTDFAGPGPGSTWNDAMSSFKTLSGGTTTGAFWWDTNDTGYYYLFGPPGSGRVSGTSYIGSTWNDQASSIQLDPNPGGC